LELNCIKLEKNFNVAKLKASLFSIKNKIPYEQNQISFQHRPNVSAFNDGIKRGENWFYNKKDGETDIEFCEFYEILQKEYIIECLKSLPFKPYRSKVMLLKPKTCYALHHDKAIRFQIPIDTAQNQGKFVFEDGKLLSLQEGSVYILNTKQRHSAINFSRNLDRVHIVGCLEEKDETDSDFVKNIYKQFNL
jgi:hypothetical protein